MGVVVDASTTIDPPGHEGLAYLSGLALDEGAAGRDAEQVGNALGLLGASVDIDVSAAGTHVFLTCPPSKLQPSLGLLAEMLAEPSFTAETVGPSRRAAARRDHQRDGVARDPRVAGAQHAADAAGYARRPAARRHGRERRHHHPGAGARLVGPSAAA